MAVNAEQVGRLDNLHDRGIKNEVPDLRVVGPDEIRDIEPNCVVTMMLVYVCFHVSTHPRVISLSCVLCFCLSETFVYCD